MRRVIHLDYLRGMAALAVMLFHFEKWGSNTWDANTFLGKSGVYAVSLFFVLSGLTLTLVYEHNWKAPAGAWRAFAIKRILRIFPLLWLATAATLILDETSYPVSHLLLNFSGLFGFFAPAADIALGAWSIGDELVYYAAFPFLLWAGQRSPWLFGLLLGLAVIAGGLYAFVWTNHESPITTQWPVYVQPLNHAFFFMSGMAIGLRREQLSRIAPAHSKRGVALCLLLYLFYTPGPGPAELITGFNRIALSLLTIGLAGSWYLAAPRFPSGPGRALRWLGEVSYSVYLLHPLVYRVLKALDARYLGGTQNGLFISALLLTLILSHFSYRWIEKPAMRLGK